MAVSTNLLYSRNNSILIRIKIEFRQVFFLIFEHMNWFFFKSQCRYINIQIEILLPCCSPSSIPHNPTDRMTDFFIYLCSDFLLIVCCLTDNISSFTLMFFLSSLLLVFLYIYTFFLNLYLVHIYPTQWPVFVQHLRCSLQILGYFDYAFTAIFTVEIVLKVNVLCVSPSVLSLTPPQSNVSLPSRS